MGYLLFNCSKCVKGLIVSEKSVGGTFMCPSCRTLNEAPLPGVRFPCGACRTDLFAAQELRGKLFVCPHCETRITVPANTTVECHNCGMFLEVDDEYYREVVGKKVNCPACGVKVPIPPIMSHIEEARAEPAAGAGKSSSTELSRKTIKLDRVLASIPQLQTLQEGKCPFCGMEVTSTSENVYVCRRCDRVLNVVKPSVSHE